MRSLRNIFRPLQWATSTPVTHDDWQTAILGPELCGTAAVASERQQLLHGMLSGEPSASALIGLLMVFRAAAVHRMPILLKDLGEAYYRWQPRTTNQPSELEKFLAAWLSETCRKAGVPMTIELVYSDERFDPTRHNASMPGVRTTQVHGWIVLRDDGKVYTKARVAVK